MRRKRFSGAWRRRPPHEPPSQWFSSQSKAQGGTRHLRVTRSVSARSRPAGPRPGSTVPSEPSEQPTVGMVHSQKRSTMEGSRLSRQAPQTMDAGDKVGDSLSATSLSGSFLQRPPPLTRNSERGHLCSFNPHLRPHPIIGTRLVMDTHGRRNSPRCSQPGREPGSKSPSQHTRANTPGVQRNTHKSGDRRGGDSGCRGNSKDDLERRRSQPCWEGALRPEGSGRKGRDTARARAAGSHSSRIWTRGQEFLAWVNNPTASERDFGGI